MNDPKPFGTPFPTTAPHEGVGGGFGPAPTKATAKKPVPVQTVQDDEAEAPKSDPADA